MRFMIIVRANADSEAGKLPEASLLDAMATYHEGLAKAGVLLDASGLQPSSKGWRVHYDDQGQRKVIDGPVSYTHLDVYKRQPRNRSCRPTGEWVDASSARRRRRSRQRPAR